MYEKCRSKSAQGMEQKKKKFYSCLMFWGTMSRGCGETEEDVIRPRK